MKVPLQTASHSLIRRPIYVTKKRGRPEGTSTWGFVLAAGLSISTTSQFDKKRSKTSHDVKGVYGAARLISPASSARSLTRQVGINPSQVTTRCQACCNACYAMPPGLNQLACFADCLTRHGRLCRC